MERRYVDFSQVTLRESTGRFVGHAAVFNERTAIGDPNDWGFWEQISPRAFDRALSEQHDVRFLVDHDPSRLLARTASGTMQLSKDKRGLRVEADIADTTIGKDVKVLLDRGDLSQMSFAFTVEDDEWKRQKDGTQLRTIEDLDLFDVSVVTFPAYESTDASLRSMVEKAGFDNIRQQRWQEMQARFAALKSPRR